jgi:hypothetical protein
MLAILHIDETLALVGIPQICTHVGISTHVEIPQICKQG